MEKLAVNLEKLNDEDVNLIRKVKCSNFTNGHKYKQCYLESDKIIPNKFNCNLPCDIYCPNRIK
jgi:hypothetical protein